MAVFKIYEKATDTWHRIGMLLFPDASQAEMEAGTETANRSMSPLRVAQAIAALITGKLNKVSGIYTGLKSTEASYTVDAGNTAPVIDLAAGNEFVLTCDTNDAFTITNANWPTTESASVVLYVDSNNASGVGTPTWDATDFASGDIINSAPDFSGITADATGYGVYLIKLIDGKWFFKTIEEA